MNKTAIKNFAIWARNKLIADSRYQLRLLGIDENGIKEKLPQSAGDMEFYDIGTRTPYEVSGEAVRQRRALVRRIQQGEQQEDYATAYENVLEESAYTWFNRLIAIRFMEVNDYLPGRLRVLSSGSVNKIEPELVSMPFDGDLDFTSAEREQISQWQEENKTDELFRLLFIKECNALNDCLPELFEKTKDYTELLLSVSVTDPDGVVYRLVHDIDEAYFNVEQGGQVEIIGWLYQYYNTEPKDKVFSRPNGTKIRKEDIPAATQLFTPDWIVRYMVENSLGRIWVEKKLSDGKRCDGNLTLDGSYTGSPAWSSGERQHYEKDFAEKMQWKYYLPAAEQEEAVEQQLAKIRAGYSQLKIEDIKLLDPCMGSGHILVYAFDVFMQIYESLGYDEKEAAESILTHNLYGLDIDDRAFQLAYFALFMKARQYSRRILKKGIELNICAIQESNGIETWEDLTDEEVRESKSGLGVIERLLLEFRDAKEYGSLLTVPAENFQKALDWLEEAKTSNLVEELLTSSWVSDLAARLPGLVKQAQLLSQLYEVVVTNPPYMGGSGMNAPLAKFVKENYPDSKSDLFAVFIERCMELTKKNGYQAMITQHAWMFLSSYEKLRVKLQHKEIVNMAHLGPRAFEEIGGEVVQTTTFVLQNMSCAGFKGTFVRLIEPTTQQGKEKMFLRGEKQFIAQQEKFKNIQGEPVVYWWKNTAIFSSAKIADYYESAGRNKTHNNDKFVHKWWEINDREKWQSYANGGNYRKWDGNYDDVVNWSENAKKVYARYGGLYNQQYCGKQGICWNLITTHKNGFRIKSSCSHFSSGSPTIIKKLDDDDLDYSTLAFLNSNVGSMLVKIFSPTMNTTVGDVLKFPLLISSRAVEISKENVNISENDHDSFEISWEFTLHPLLKYRSYFATVENNEVISRDCTGIRESFEIWKSLCNHYFDTLKENEEELNRIFIDIYGLADELTPEVADKDVTVARIYDTKEEIPESMKGNAYVLTKADVIKSLLSYAVGCMFGRYSLDVEGLAYAGGDWDASKYTTFIPDADNVIPIFDEAYSDDDIVQLFTAWLKKVYGDETLEENLAFIADALGKKPSESSRECIRQYFLKNFYKDHVKMYKKRPIYWLYDSGKKNGFKALIYMHRYDADTTGRVRADYLHRIERTYESEIERMTSDINHGDDARDIAKATKRRDKLQKQLKECQEYDEQISQPALARIDIDLDDGVKVNYEKVQTVNGKTYKMLAKI